MNHHFSSKQLLARPSRSLLFSATVCLTVLAACGFAGFGSFTDLASLISPRECLAQERQASNASAQDHSAVEGELKAFRDSILKSFQAGDLEAVLNHAAPDVVVTWQNAEVTVGRDQARKYHQDKMQGPNSPVLAITENPQADNRLFLAEEVISFGNMNDVFTLRDFSEPLALNSRFTAVIGRIDGKLTLRALHLSVNAFNNPIMNMAQKTLTRYAALAAFLAFLIGMAFGRVTKK